MKKTTKAPRQGRLILLGIDSLDLPLTRRFADSGVMPNFARLLKTSPVASLSDDSTSPLPTAVWMNLMTGVSPGVHGFLEGMPLRRTRPSDRHFFSERFYKTLSDRGIRCAAVDVPVDYPLRPFNGLQVVDWGAEFSLGELQTEPRSFKRRLTDTYGEHPLTGNPPVQIDPGSLKQLRAGLETGIRQKARLIADLMASPFEFLFLNYGELHKAGHYFWRFFDPAHPDYDASDPELAGALEHLHRVLDEKVGELLDDLDESDNLIIISDRGMESHHRGNHLMEEALVRMGFMTRRAAPDQTPAAPGGSLPLLGKSGLRRLGRRLLPDALRKSLKPWYRRTIGEEPPVDEDRTQVFFESSVGNSYLRINLVGRYPNGVVPAAEYDKLLHEIERELYALVNPATGTRVVKHVYFPWRMFNGPKRDSLPDISIQWNAQYRVDAMESETIGRVAKPFVDNRSGNHNTEAFLLCRGPGFIDSHVQVEADSRQLAPTVFSLLNETPPEHYELGPVSDVLQSGDVVAFSSWRRRAV